jgi:hypothetical protein
LFVCSIKTIPIEFTRSNLPRLGLGLVDQTRERPSDCDNDIELLVVAFREALVLLKRISLAFTEQEEAGVVFCLRQGSEDTVVKTFVRGKVPAIRTRRDPEPVGERRMRVLSVC